MLKLIHGRCPDFEGRLVICRDMSRKARAILDGRVDGGIH